MDVSDENFLDGLMDGLEEGVTPLTQDDATNEDNHHPEKLLVDDQVDLELGADQDLMESQQQEEHQQQEQHQQEEQQQEQHIYNINHDVE